MLYQLSYQPTTSVEEYQSGSTLSTRAGAEKGGDAHRARAG